MTPARKKQLLLSSFAIFLLVPSFLFDNTPISQFSEMQFSGKNEVVGRVKSGCTVGVHLRLGGLGNSYCPEVSHCLPLYEQPLITKQASWPTQTPAGARSSYFPLSFEHLPSFLLLLSYVSSVRTRTMHCFSDPRM